MLPEVRMTSSPDTKHTLRMPFSPLLKGFFLPAGQVAWSVPIENQEWQGRDWWAVKDSNLQPTD